MKFLLGLKRAGFNVYVALNMLICSVLFFGASKPRETLSGFVGRTFMLVAVRLAKWEGEGVQKSAKYVVLNTLAYGLLGLARSIDWAFREVGHCGETAEAEYVMRQELYPEESSVKDDTLGI